MLTYSKIITIFFLAFLSFISINVNSNEIIIDNILILNISSSINPATYNYIENGDKKSKELGSDLIVIKLNTPGGLVSTTKKIITLIGKSDIPYLIWVTPEGSSATSAGAIIASSAHILVMTNGTNIGAATPITISGPMKKDDDLRKKSINDLVALVKGLSQERGRNQKLFEEMITKAASFTSKDAITKNLIDGIINNKEELKKFINGKKLKIKGKKVTLKLGQGNFTPLKMDLGQELLNIFANPSTSYILFLIGAVLIYLELQAPGGFIAGAIGALALVLAGIGFQVVPINIGALGLIILSFILFVLEVYIVSYGILAISGLIAMIFGSLFLFRTNDVYIELSTSVVISAVSAVAIFIGIVGYFIFKDMFRKRKAADELFSLLGKTAIVSSIGPSESKDGEIIYTYKIKIEGEIWNATSKSKFIEHDKVLITTHNSKRMILEISQQES